MDEILELKKVINKRKIIKLQQVLREVLVNKYLSPSSFSFEEELKFALEKNNLKFKLIERESDIDNKKFIFRILSQYTKEILLITLTYNV